MKRHNFNYRLAVIAMSLLAVLATGCKKDKNMGSRLSISTEHFRNVGSKVAFNPANPQDTNYWVAGERIRINGSANYWVAVAEFTDGSHPTKYYLTTNPDAPENADYDVSPNSVTFPLTALYPGASFGGNDVAVSNSEMVLTTLDIDFLPGSPVMQKMAFPMIAKAQDDETTTLLFHHLTGGLKLTLNNGEATGVDLATLKIVAWGTNDQTANMTYEGYTVRWAQDGPTVPGGHAGEIEEDLSVDYASDMRFTLRTNGVEGVTVPAGGHITFCVPITINTVHYLTVTGYDAAGDEVFCKTADLSSETSPHGVSVVRNHMYPVRAIPINYTDSKK